MSSSRKKRLVFYAAGCLLVGLLGSQTISLFLGKMHTQGVADIAAQTALRKMLSGIASQAEIKSIILSEIGAGDLGRSGFGKIGAKDICFDSLSCSSPVKVVGGCYDPTNRQFSCSAALGSLSCTAPATPSVFTLMEMLPSDYLTSLFMATGRLVGFKSSVNALAYGNMQTVLRDQPQLIASVSQCHSS